MNSLTPWERLLSAGSAFELTPVRDSEIANFYWCTEIKTPEIWEAFSDQIAGLQSLEVVGPALFVGRPCTRCSRGVYAFSRNDAVQRVKSIEEEHSPRYAKWADPSICRECKRALHDADQKDSTSRFKAEMEARAKAIRDLRSLPYAAYLRTDHWQRTRAAAIKRARSQCQTCAAGGVLHVHHRTYIRRGEEWNSDLIVLCEPCHSIFHEHRELSEQGRAA